MRRYHDSILHSAGDLHAFLGCAHSVVLNARAAEGSVRLKAALPAGARAGVAVVPANPKLLELKAKSVEHLRLVDTLVRLTAEAGEGM